jgi:class 3 adenylate cyclase
MMREPRDPGASEISLRRSRRIDWLLLATLLPIYVGMQVAGLRAHLATGERALPVRLSGAQGAQGYPVVLSLKAPNPAIRPGDRVMRLGDVELRGLSFAEIEQRAMPLLRAGAPFEVELERDAARIVARAEPLPDPFWWWPTPVWLSLVGVASFLLLRAPHWSLARPFFVLSLAWACVGTNRGPNCPFVDFMGSVLAYSVGLGLTLWFFLSWAAPARRSRWPLVVAGSIGLAAASSQTASLLLTLPAGSVPTALTALIGVVFITLSLAALARAYRRSDALERRQLRWIFYAHVVGMLPIGVVFALQQVLPLIGESVMSLAWVFVAAIPLGYVVAIVGYGWLDVDRVISASAAATLVGVTLLGGLLAIVPPLASAASTALGIEPETGRLVLSMGLATVLVPAYRRLRPRLDHWMFAEQHALAARFETLRTELGASRGVEEMATRAGEGFEALLKPESVAIYGRVGEAFTPLFLRGKALSPAFEANSMLVQVLEAKREPLFARAKELRPFERAALETLGAEVVVPQLRGDQLVAFTCLGTKKSGDIYTATDLALLASVAARCGEVIERIDLETLAKESQAMQSALRRYVPGALANRVLAGDALAPSEREVTVLFVDIRGYTGLAERLGAEDVFATLNEHTERVSRIVQEHGGTIVEFNGDGMMAVFGAPDPLPKKEQAAVEAARKIVDSMPGQLAVGVGVATGPAFVGSIRSTDRLIWSVVGSTTNLAARLQALTRELDASIALDETTRERAGYVGERFVCHAGLAIRGRTGRFDVFALRAA